MNSKALVDSCSEVKAYHTFLDSNGIRYIQYLLVSIPECYSYLLDDDIDKQMTSVHNLSNN